MSLLFNMLPRLVITFLPRSKRLLICLNISFLGEGNGNPLQYSCRENPRIGGAWWAALYGIAQSRTRLKWLSSSSNIRHYRMSLHHALVLCCYKRFWHLYAQHFLFSLDLIFNYKLESVRIEVVLNGLTSLNHLHCLIHPPVMCPACFAK